MSLPAQSPPTRPARPALVRTLTTRLAVTTILVMLLQAGIVSVRDYLGETDFLSGHVRREARRIVDGLQPGNPDLGGAAGVVVSPYAGTDAQSYAFRVIAADGSVIAGHNVGLLAPWSPWSQRPSPQQDFWLRKLDPVERMHVAGGIKLRRETDVVWVELATIGDPADTYLRSIVLDAFSDVWVPMLPLVVLTFLVTLTSVRRSLRPLFAAANRADEISGLERGERLDVAQLPEEASRFAAAVNRLLDRVADLVAAQRLFIARAAHELRTPLSIIMLELGHIKDPHAKRLEADVQGLSRIVDQLLSLARLEGVEKPEMAPVELSAVVREVAARMLGWVEKDGHKLEFVAGFDGTIIANDVAVREAVRNLIENAVKHTPPATSIRVEVAQDASIVVEDDGPGFGTQTAGELLLPFRKGSSTGDGAGLGLSIVHQTAQLHGGRLEVGASALGGARLVLTLAHAALPSAGNEST